MDEQWLSHTWYSQLEHPDEAFTDDECDELLRLARLQPTHTRGLRNSDWQIPEEQFSVKSYRLDWNEVPDAHPLMQKMANVVWQANQHLWQFELERLSWVEVLHYEESHQYIDHIDWLPHHPLMPRPPVDRKLSFTVQLSESDAYKGGDLIFNEVGRDGAANRERGTIVVFPSFMQHRVSPVMKGERWSCVGWVLGPPFR